jgi:streptogramin lyase
MRLGDGGFGRGALSLLAASVCAISLPLMFMEGCYTTIPTWYPDGGDGVTVDRGFSDAGEADSSIDSAVVPKENGDTCVASDQCKSGICMDGVCCDKTCSGVCLACNLPATKGKCSPIVSQEDDDCRGLRSCDTTGTCTDRFTEFPTPTPASGPLKITLGSDGYLWFTESAANKIGTMTVLGSISEFSIPTVGSFPIGITAGSDGHIWFVESSGNKVARVVIPGSFMEFDVPTTNSAPVGIVSGADGKLWFVENGINSIGSMTVSGTFDDALAVPNARYLVEITATPNGDIWFTEGDGNRVGRIAGGVVTMYPIQTAASGPREIAAGPDGKIWFAQNGGSIGRSTR